MEHQDTIFAIIEEQLYYRSLEGNEFLKIEIPEITLKQFSIKDEILYIYNGQNLTSFRLNQSKE
jgi:hypothetical protein